MAKADSQVSYSLCNEDICVQDKNIFKNESKYSRYNICGKKAKDDYKNIRKSKKSVDSVRPSVTECESKEKLDTIRSGESLIKMFIFEPTKYTSDTEKCIAFWEYIRNREDLKPVKSTLIEGVRKESNGIDANTQTEEGVVECKWYKALLELRKRKLDKLAMSTALPACKLCNQKLIGEDEYMHTDENEKADILALSDWDPNRKTYVDVATQPSLMFTDNWNDTQDTESFENLCKAMKEAKYADKGTAVQRYESLMRIKKRVHLRVDEKKNKVYKIGDEYPLKEICKCRSEASTIEITKCPYNIPKCTCGSINEEKPDLEQLTCPYHVSDCNCDRFNSETKPIMEVTCPYHISECDCSNDETKPNIIIEEINEAVCPYHVADCSCGNLDENKAFKHLTSENKKKSVKVLFEAKTNDRLLNEASYCECESENELICSCSDEQIEEIRPVENVVLCPYKVSPCNCADEEITLMNTSKVPLQKPKKLLKNSFKSVGVQSKIEEKHVKLPNKLCLICGLLDCNC